MNAQHAVKNHVVEKPRVASKGLSGVLVGLTIASILSTQTRGIVAQLSLILSLLLFNALMGRVYHASRKVVVLLGILESIIILLAYVQHYNAVDAGFSDGLLSGEIGTNLYTDTKAYYDEAMILGGMLRESHFWDYLKGDFESFGFYGPYNLYNFWNAVLYLLFGDFVVSWVLVKSIFSIWGFYMLWRLAQKFVSSKNAETVVVILALFPGYLLCASTLMRDNIIVTLVIAFFYRISVATSEGLTRGIIGVLLIAIATVILRGYLVIIYGIVGIYLLLMKRVTAKRVVILIFVLFSLAAGFYLLLSFPFFYRSFIAIQWAQDFFSAGGSWSVIAERSTGFNLLLFSAFYYAFGSSPVAGFYDLRFVTEVLNYASGLYLNILLSLSAISIIFIWKRQLVSRNMLLLIGVLMPLTYIALYTYAFGGPVPRIYGPVLWIFAIAAARFYQIAPRGLFIRSVSFTIVLTITVHLYKYLLVM